MKKPKVWYSVILVALAVVAIQSGRLLAGPFARSPEAAAVFIGSIVLFGAMVAVLLLGLAVPKLRELWPVRMVRLWAQAKEAELKKRAR